METERMEVMVIVMVIIMVVVEIRNEDRIINDGDGEEVNDGEKTKITHWN